MKDKDYSDYGGSKKAQAAVEMAVVFILLFIFFIGALKVFVWANRCIVERHEAYMLSRHDDCGTFNSETNFYTRPDIKAF